MREDFLCGVDFGKRRDNASFVINRRTPLVVPPTPVGEEPEDDPLFLRVVYALKSPLRTSYRDLARHAADLATFPVFRGRIQFALETNGPGEPALEMFEEEPALEGLLWPVYTSSGQTARREKNTNRWTVPKKDLKDAAKVLFQLRRVACNPLDPYHMDDLRTQLFAFKMKVRPNASISFEAQTEADHDDVCMSFLLSCWLSGRVPLEDYDPSSGPGEPGVLLPGPEGTVGRPAPSWRDGEVIRPAGTPPLEMY